MKPTPDYKPYSEQELYIRQLNHTRINGRIGSRLTQVYKPQRDINNPPKFDNTTIAKLMALDVIWVIQLHLSVQACNHSYMVYMIKSTLLI